ncbi:glycoside hydrolase family 13 protein [Agrilactobacillus fermenti]|uniref:glycoside hydrolase family 13 protein n=1 Tax=Agrilactobacillus fermenti TaxID=2586909 RepID=UPI001E553597|nr:alpha-glucosidase [Agrilactobacillus fermenti]MCD2256062.1 alpha-glucosidase [Agrilactobacillus fermenti]
MTDIKWWQKAVVYQIYPKSFQDSNHDGIGDLKGIIEHLDYLKLLGVDVLWLNPIYKTRDIDGGYDISDYQAINPDFGTMADFDLLIQQAHQRGLKIIMDLVVNHTSDYHEWFQKSRAQKENNVYRDYYIWRDPVDDHEPNNWGSAFSGPAWQYDPVTQQYYLHIFAKEQPDLNWDNTNVRNAVFDMMNWWATKGIDGFRMDVISLISKPKNLPDAPKAANELYGKAGSVVANGPHVHDYLREMNQKVLSHHNWMTVGETSGVTIDEAKKYANLDGSELNMVFHFKHMGLDRNVNPALGKWCDQPVPLKTLRSVLTDWQQQLHGQAWNSLYWNNHDQPRVVSRFGNDAPEYRVYAAKMLAALLHFMQGTPYIYQGEELGMTNATFRSSADFRDLESINAYHELVDKNNLLDGPTMLRYLNRHSRDNARTPMQWRDAPNAGFSDHQPWLAVNENYPEINAENEVNDPNGIFHFYRRLIALRHKLPIITLGDYCLVPGNENDDAVFAYTRQYETDHLMVIANFTQETVQRHYAFPESKTRLVQNYPDDLADTLRPYEVKVYQY